MKAPRNMSIIQIEVTNACVYTCSNCTRLCGHHAKPYMMDFETFKRAVDSLEGYAGTVSMMGGEPTLHPEFEKFALYLKSKYPHLYEEENEAQLLHPMDDFMKSVQDVSLDHVQPFESDTGEVVAMFPVPGLYSMMGSTYLKHYELIQDIFKRQVLNDHTNEMYHQPALISRKDLGISDEDWIPMRDNCWLQNSWSASITPKGAFFCEIAAALDMLFDGPGGWPIEKDWWKRNVEDFADQLHWCELCGFACETFTRNANDYIDDVSPILHKKLEKVNSPKMKSDRVRVIKMKDGVIAEESKASDFTYSSSSVGTGSPYIKYIAEKFDDARSLLHPQNFVALYHFTASATPELMEKRLEFMVTHCKKAYVFCENKSVLTQWQNVAVGQEILAYDLESRCYGHLLNEILPTVDSRDYIIALSQFCELTTEFLDKFKKSTANSGSLIYSGSVSNGNNLSHWVQMEEGETGFLGIFNPTASSLRDMGFDRRAYLKNFSDLAELWTKRKKIPFDENLFVYSSKEIVQEGERCAIFGAGGRSSDVYYLILQQKGTCVAVVDSDPEKQGNIFEHLVVEAPDYLGGLRDEIDRVLIGTPIYFEEMKEKLLSLGFQEDIISQI